MSTEGDQEPGPVHINATLNGEHFLIYLEKGMVIGLKYNQIFITPGYYHEVSESIFNKARLRKCLRTRTGVRFAVL
jgi:hypothetical protein